MTDTVDSVAGAHGPAPAPRRRGHRLHAVVSALGELLITAGVVVLLFVAYELWGTGAYTAQEQHTLQHNLKATWTGQAQHPVGTRPAPKPTADPTYPKVPEGQGIAILYIPALGKDYHYVVVEGVSHDDLKKGPGHYPKTAMPGQHGNLVVSGHRTTYLAPFNRIDELKPGDAVIFETADAWYVYRVANVPAYRLKYQEIVSPDDIDEIDPVPNQPGVKATEQIFTFTTCNPKYSARQRLVVHGVLDHVVPKGGPPPSELDPVGGH